MTYALYALFGAAALAGSYYLGRLAKRAVVAYLFTFCKTIADGVVLNEIRRYHTDRQKAGLDPTPEQVLAAQKAAKQAEELKTPNSAVKYIRGQQWGQCRGFQAHYEKATPDEIADATKDPLVSIYGEKEKVH